VRAAKPHAAGGVGLANFALNYIFTDQSDGTKTIWFNYIHDSGCCKRLHVSQIGPVRSRRLDPS